MSVKMLTRVWDASQHCGTHLLLMLAFADFSDDNGNSYPSIATVARKCRMSPRNVNLLLTALKASGELQVLENKGPAGCNRYRIRLDDDGVKPASPLKSASPLKPASPPEDAFTLKPASSTPEAGFTTPLKPASDKPSFNRQEPSSIVRAPRAPRAKRMSGEHPLFGEFYAAYPRKVARPKAAQAFAKVDPDRSTLDAMLAAIKAQGLADKCAAGEEQYVPHPATWLNQTRWTDGGAKRSASAGPAWLAGTGFATLWEAESAGCGPGNAAMFRNGRKVAA